MGSRSRKESRETLRPRKTLKALWPLSRRIQRNDCICICIYICVRSEKPNPQAGKPCLWKGTPTKSGQCSQDPGHPVGWISAGSRTCDLFCLISLSLFLSSLFSFILLFLLLLNGRGKSYQFPCWVCSLQTKLCELCFGTILTFAILFRPQTSTILGLPFHTGIGTQQ